MADKPQRITWERGPYGGFYGAVASHKDLFTISQSTRRGDYGWILRTRLTGMDDRAAKSEDEDELKAKAEEWLEQFVASLGATFGQEG